MNQSLHVGHVVIPVYQLAHNMNAEFKHRRALVFQNIYKSLSKNILNQILHVFENKLL